MRREAQVSHRKSRKLAWSGSISVQLRAWHAGHSRGPRSEAMALYPAPIPIRIAHAAFAFVAAAVLWRAMAQAWVADITVEAAVVAVLGASLPLASLAGSALLLA